MAGSFAPHDAELVNLLEAKKAPGGEYLMGTDWLGRCIFSRILSGASSSIFASPCDCGAVYAGRLCNRTDQWIRWWHRRVRNYDACCRCVSCFSGIVLSIAVAGMLGPGLRNGVLALAATGWTQYARLIRSYVLSIRQENFVKAARLNGQSEWSILMHHVFPNAIRPVVVTGTLHLSGAMLSISGLSFLGLGSSSAEWGSMLSEGRSLMQQCPWMVLYPALAIFFVTILFNLLGDSVRDASGSAGNDETINK